MSEAVEWGLSPMAARSSSRQPRALLEQPLLEQPLLEQPLMLLLAHQHLPLQAAPVVLVRRHARQAAPCHPCDFLHPSPFVPSVVLQTRVIDVPRRCGDRVHIRQAVATDRSGGVMQHDDDSPAARPLVVLNADGVEASFGPDDGGRLRSLRIGHHELIVDDALSLGRGCYPMVPWAGRVDRGRFSFEGERYELPLDGGDHALHGTGYTSSWHVIDRHDDSIAMSLDLDHRWPLGGRVEHRATLAPNHLHLELEVFAGHDAMPAMIGWHPWFVRRLHAAGPAPSGYAGDHTSFAAEATLDFGSAQMYELVDMIPTGALVDPSSGPWDDCFTALGRDPHIVWPGVLELDLSSSCDHWVIYSQPDHALCVEPQTDAPNAFNRDADVIEAGGSLLATFDLRWRTLAS